MQPTFRTDPFKIHRNKEIVRPEAKLLRLAGPEGFPTHAAIVILHGEQKGRYDPVQSLSNPH